jgi:DNA polymerase-1
VINFGLIYGMSAFGLAQNLGIERATAQALHRVLLSAATRASRNSWTRRARKRARTGYVETVFGRRLRLPEIQSARPRAARRRARRHQRADAGHRGRPHQAGDGRGAELAGAKKLQTKLIMQVHDELVLEVPEKELDEVKEKVRELMQNVAQLDVPLIVDAGVGDNWDQAH